MADSNPKMDDALLEELGRVFKGEAHERVGTLRQLLADLRAKAGEPDALLKHARREAHNLKGSAATVDAMDAHALALRLEKHIDLLSGAGVFPSPIALAAMGALVEALAKVVGAPAPA